LLKSDIILPEYLPLIIPHLTSVDNCAKMKPPGFFAKLPITSLMLFCLLVSCDEIIDSVPPTPLITFYPKQGDTSTFFSFDGSGSTDNMSEIWQLQFRWDFDGDGIWDTDWTREPKARCTCVAKVQHHQRNRDFCYKKGGSVNGAFVELECS